MGRGSLSTANPAAFGSSLESVQGDQSTVAPEQDHTKILYTTVTDAGSDAVGLLVPDPRSANTTWSIPAASYPSLQVPDRLEHPANTYNSLSLPASPISSPPFQLFASDSSNAYTEHFAPGYVPYLGFCPSNSLPYSSSYNPTASTLPNFYYEPSKFTPVFHSRNPQLLSMNMASGSANGPTSGMALPLDVKSEGDRNVAMQSHPLRDVSSMASNNPMTVVPKMITTPTSGSSPSRESIDSAAVQASSPRGLQQANAKPRLPFENTVVVEPITCNGSQIIPEISGQVCDSVFPLDGHWVSYRRNYMSVECSYSLNPCQDNMILHLHPTDSKGQSKGPLQIKALALGLQAVVDKVGGKVIELVQHTPKRDKGPQLSMRIEKLNPNSKRQLPTSPHSSPPSCPYLPLQNEKENGLDPSIIVPDPKHCQHTFERIQFKQATANNGRRRAQQQYYHLIINLYADVRGNGETAPSWHIIARKVSYPLIVRGRSPGHYRSEENRTYTRGSDDAAAADENNQLVNANAVSSPGYATQSPASNGGSYLGGQSYINGGMSTTHCSPRSMGDFASLNISPASVMNPAYQAYPTVKQDDSLSHIPRDFIQQPQHHHYHVHYSMLAGSAYGNPLIETSLSRISDLRYLDESTEEYSTYSPTQYRSPSIKIPQQILSRVSSPRHEDIIRSPRKYRG